MTLVYRPCILDSEMRLVLTIAGIMRYKMITSAMTSYHKYAHMWIENGLDCCVLDMSVFSLIPDIVASQRIARGLGA
jgi:hypothetical protein